MTADAHGGDRTAAVRLPCQVCGRSLTTRRDGLTKPHNRRRNHSSWCSGSGHRQARWPVGQKLRHHAGSAWEVIEDRGAAGGDYLLRCIIGTPGWAGGEKVGHEMVTHGEYMHRDGWRPLDA